MVRKEEYDEEDLELIKDAKKWRTKGFIVFVEGSIHCYGCENAMPLRDPLKSFPHEKNCEVKRI